MNYHRLALIIASAFAVGAAVAVPSPEPEHTETVSLEGWTVRVVIYNGSGIGYRVEVICKDAELDLDEKVVECPARTIGEEP